MDLIFADRFSISRISHYADENFSVFVAFILHSFLRPWISTNLPRPSLSIHFFRSARSLILSLPFLLFFMWIFAWILLLIWYHISLHIIRGSVKLPFCISTGRNSIKFGHKPQYFISTFDGKLIRCLSLAG